MDAAFVVGLINLFFVPLLPVYLYYKKNGRPLEANLDLLFQYAIATALLIPLTKAVAFLPGRLIAHEPISLVSGYYTLAALIASWLLPRLADLAGSVSAGAKGKEKGGSSDDEGSPGGAAK